MIETAPNSETLPTRESIINASKIINRACMFFSDVNTDQVGTFKVGVLKIRTSRTKDLGEGICVINTASVNETPLATIQRTIKNGKLTNVHYSLRGQDRYAGWVLLKTDQDFEANNNLLSEIKTESKRKGPINLEDCSIDELQELASIFDL